MSQTRVKTVFAVQLRMLVGRIEMESVNISGVYNICFSLEEYALWLQREQAAQELFRVKKEREEKERLRKEEEEVSDLANQFVHLHLPYLKLLASDFN